MILIFDMHIMGSFVIVVMSSSSTEANTCTLTPCVVPIGVCSLAPVWWSFKESGKLVVAMLLLWKENAMN